MATNTVDYFTPSQVRLLQDAASEVEMGLEGFGDDVADMLGFVLRSFANGRDAGSMRYRALQLARTITGKIESDYEGGA